MRQQAEESAYAAQRDTCHVARRTRNAPVWHRERMAVKARGVIGGAARAANCAAQRDGEARALCAPRDDARRE